MSDEPRTSERDQTPAGVIDPRQDIRSPAAAANGTHRGPRLPLGLGRLALGAPAITLTLLVTLAFEMFLLIEPTPRWLALFVAAVAALSTEGVLRSARRQPFELGVDTTPYLFLPALYALATPVLIEDNVRGYWAVAAGLLGGLGFGAVIVAEIASVREFDPLHGVARFVATAATYFVAFALFALGYRFELGVQAGIAAVALISLLLAIEILREGEVDPLETLVFAAVTALVVTETRWTLHFLPLDGYLAGLTLLLSFYFVTGLLHSHVTRRLDAVVAAEYALIAALGVALIAGARAGGLT